MILTVPAVVRPECQRWRLTKLPQESVFRQRQLESTGGGPEKTRRPGATRGSSSWQSRAPEWVTALTAYGRDLSHIQKKKDQRRRGS